MQTSPLVYLRACTLIQYQWTNKFAKLQISESTKQLNFSSNSRLSSIFQGDIEFQESQNASLVVHASAEDDDMKRIRVEYDLLQEGAIVDIQVVSYQ